MNLYLSQVISIEVDETTKSSDIDELSDKLNLFFQDKSYSDDVEEYAIDIVLVAPEFRKFSPPIRPRYNADRIIKFPNLPPEMAVHIKKHLLIQIELDFDTFITTTREEGYQIIANDLLKYLNEMKYPVKIRKSFKKDLFNQDMKRFFEGIGCVFH